MAPLTRSSARVARDVVASDLVPPKKRQKRSTTSAKPRGKQGALEMLVDMPIDVLFEIFSHLLPPDLLNLTRTTKALRGLLMHRDSTTVWKSARENLDNQDLYKGPSKNMSEPAYARLVFDTHCYFCLTARVKNPFWAWKLRCCKTCMPKHFGKAKEAFKDVLPRYEEPRCFPDEIYGKSESNIYMYSAIQEFVGEAEKAYKEGCLAPFFGYRLNAAAETTAWADEERNNASCREHSHLNRLETIRGQRQTAIKNKLCELGWEQELNLMPNGGYSFEHHGHVFQTKPLTDRIWNNIERPMIQFMEEVKAKRLERERIDRIIQRQNVVLPLLLTFRQTRQSHIKVPTDADIVCMPPFAALIESDQEDGLTAESFGDAISLLPQLCIQWWVDCDKFLYTLLPQASASECEFRLELATTLFECGGCSIPISYPRILAHKCMTDLEWLQKDPVLMLDESMRRFQSLGCLPYNLGGNWCLYHHKAATLAAGIIQACGMDPQITTLTQMDEKDVMFSDKCIHHLFRDSSEKYVYFMNWRVAIEHAVKKHENTFETKPIKWIAFDAEKNPLDAYIMRTSGREDKRAMKRMELERPDWCCRRCITFRGTFAEMRPHLNHEHGEYTDYVIEDNHCFKHFDAPLPAIPFAVPKIFTQSRFRSLDHEDMLALVVELEDRDREERLEAALKQMISVVEDHL